MENKSVTTIIVFQQHGSGEEKIAGIKEYGMNIEITQVIDIDEALPEFIDDPKEYVPTDFSGDMVLSFLKHPDLVEGLADICNEKNIPMVASGQKAEKAITPFTCCGLGVTSKLGAYGEQFGIPEYKVTLEDGKIKDLKILRGASCGATWRIVEKVVGLTPDEALIHIAREAQYICKADPSKFDPITGKSPLHYAGDVHYKALLKAIENA